LDSRLSHSGFGALPPELRLHICDFFDEVKDLCYLGATCRELRVAVASSYNFKTLYALKKIECYGLEQLKEGGDHELGQRVIRMAAFSHCRFNDNFQEAKRLIVQMGRYPRNPYGDLALEVYRRTEDLEQVRTLAPNDCLWTKVRLTSLVYERTHDLAAATAIAETAGALSEIAFKQFAVTYYKDTADFEGAQKLLAKAGTFAPFALKEIIRHYYNTTGNLDETLFMAQEHNVLGRIDTQYHLAEVVYAKTLSLAQARRCFTGSSPHQDQILKARLAPILYQKRGHLQRARKWIRNGVGVYKRWAYAKLSQVHFKRRRNFKQARLIARYAVFEDGDEAERNEALRSIKMMDLFYRTNIQGLMKNQKIDISDLLPSV